WLAAGETEHSVQASDFFRAADRILWVADPPCYMRVSHSPREHSIDHLPSMNTERDQSASPILWVVLPLAVFFKEHLDVVLDQHTDAPHACSLDTLCELCNLWSESEH